MRLVALLVALACADRPTPPTQRSVLLIWLDDVSSMELALYGGPVSMPHLEALAADGVTFTRMYANANCTPSRRCAMTGRWWIRGAGEACSGPSEFTPDPIELWLPEALPGHVSALIGKWHLGAAPSGAAWECAPLEHGFDYAVAMLPANVGQCGGSGYSAWPSTDMCEPWALASAYQPHAARDALVFGWGQSPFPRLAVVSANLAHAPIHVVPAPHAPPVSTTQRAKYEAMLRAYDDLIGDMVAAVDLSKCVVVVIGDNGTYGPVAPQGQEARAKGTVFERGVRVPCVISGADIEKPGRSSDTLAHVADLWPTLVECAGGSLPPGYPIDGISLKPTLRNVAQGEHAAVLVGCNWNGAGAERGVVTRTRKLRQVDDDGDGILEYEELFDLEADPTELVNVAEEPAFAKDLAALQAFALAETP